MTERLKQIETIARACGWHVLSTPIDPDFGIEIHIDGGPEFFNPFYYPGDWFWAFDAMECKFLTVNKMIFVAGPDMWTVKVDGDYYAEHPDRLTAMGLALHAAARAKLGEVEADPLLETGTSKHASDAIAYLTTKPRPEPTP